VSHSIRTNSKLKMQN